MAEFVVGPRELLQKWCHRTWPDVMAAAEAGTDGLRPTNFNEYKDMKTGEFKLRKIVSLSLGELTGLYAQNW